MFGDSGFPTLVRALHSGCDKLSRVKNPQSSETPKIREHVLIQITDLGTFSAQALLRMLCDGNWFWTKPEAEMSRRSVYKLLVANRLNISKYFF